MNYLVIKEYDTKIRFELTIQNTVNVVKIIICEKHGKSNGLYIPEKTNSGRLRIWISRKLKGWSKKGFNKKYVLNPKSNSPDILTFIWDKLGWLNWFWQFFCDWLPSKMILLLMCILLQFMSTLIKKLTDINWCLTDPANRCLTDINRNYISYSTYPVLVILNR